MCTFLYFRIFLNRKKHESYFNLKGQREKQLAKLFLLEDRGGLLVFPDPAPGEPSGSLGQPGPLTLQMRAMRDTMVFSKNSNSWPVSLKKK